jgi:hypothetical protein
MSFGLFIIIINVLIWGWIIFSYSPFLFMILSFLFITFMTIYLIVNWEDIEDII